MEDPRPAMRAMPQIAATRRTYVYREQTDSIRQLLRSLSVAQGEMTTPKRTTPGQYGKFADLEDLKAASRVPLASNGLAIMQTFACVDAELYLNTTLGHESGEWISSQIPIKQHAEAQKTCAYMTYMQRKAYASILTLASEVDDDGVTANACSAGLALESQTAAFARASKALNFAKDPLVIDKILELTKEKMADGSMAPDALRRLEAMAVDIRVTIAQENAAK